MNNQNGYPSQQRQQELIYKISAKLQELHNCGYSVQSGNFNEYLIWMSQQINAQSNEQAFVREKLYEMTIGRPKTSLDLGTPSQPQTPASRPTPLTVGLKAGSVAHTNSRKE